MPNDLAEFKAQVALDAAKKAQQLASDALAKDQSGLTRDLVAQINRAVKALAERQAPRYRMQVNRDADGLIQSIDVVPK